MQLNEPQILIADDDADLRSALAEALERRGYHTTLVGDGQEALEVIQSRITLHLAILDVHMPRLSGLETLEQIRRMNVPKLPCILMTLKSIRLSSSSAGLGGFARARKALSTADHYRNSAKSITTSPRFHAVRLSGRKWELNL